MVTRDENGDDSDPVESTIQLPAWVTSIAPATVLEGGSIYLHVESNYDAAYKWDLDGDGVFGESGSAAARGNENGTYVNFSAAGLAGDSFVVKVSMDASPLHVVAERAVQIDRAPRVTSIATNGPVSGGLLHYSVKFSEAVTGVGVGDFALSTTGSASGASISGVTGSGSTYEVTVSPGTGWGTLRLNLVDDDSIHGLVGNKLGTTGAGNGNFVGGVATPSAKITHAVSVVEGATYSVSMGTDFGTAPSGTTWEVDWGDGSPSTTETGSSPTLQHDYEYGSGVYVVSAVGTAPDGTTILGDATVVKVKPAAPSNFTVTAAASGSVSLSWVTHSNIAAGYQLEVSVDAGEYVVIDTGLGAYENGYYIPFLAGGINYSFRLAARNQAGLSTAVTAAVTTPVASSGTLTNWWNAYGYAFPGFRMNFYGQDLGTILINENGNIGAYHENGVLTTSMELSYSVIAPFFSDVALWEDGEVSYGPAIWEGKQAFGVHWTNVDYEGNFVGHVPSYNSYSLYLVNRSETGEGNFDIVFQYGDLAWDTAEESGGYQGHVNPDDSMEYQFPARAGYSNGSGMPGTFSELPGSGQPEGLLSLANTTVTFPIRNIDLDIDSDNNGVVDHSIVEDETEDVLGNGVKPGKIAWVNGGDADGDGVPDYADGFDRDGQKAADASGHFTPVTLYLPAGIDLSRTSIELQYNFADPAAIYRTEYPDGRVTWSPGSGHLRVWRKDGTVGRTVVGDLVVEGEQYAATDFAGAVAGGTVTLWVEAVNASSTVGDQVIRVVLRDTLKTGVLTDQVRMSLLDWRMDTVDGYGHLSPADTLRQSTPSPEVHLEAPLLTNLHTSFDKKHIFADLHIQGAVDSLIADNTPGEEGTIDEVFVYLNGSATPLARIPLKVHKYTTGQILHPFDYSGGIVTDAGGAVILVGVELMPGENTVEVVAREKVTGYAGFAKAIFPVLAVVDYDPFRLYFGPPGGTDSLPQTVNVTYALGAPVVTLTRVVGGGSTVVYSASMPGGSATLTVADPDEWAESLAENGEDVPWHATMEGFAELGAMIGMEQDTSDGSDRRYKRSITDYGQYTITAGAASLGDRSEGGEAVPYVVEAVGPAALLDRLQMDASQGAGQPDLLPMALYEGHYVVGQPPELGELAGAGMPLLSYLLNQHHADPLRDPLEVDLELELQNLEGLPLDSAKFTAGMYAGMPIGFASGGVSMVGGVIDLGKWILNADSDFLGHRIAWVCTLGDTPLFSDTERNLAMGTWNVGKSIVEFQQFIDADRVAILQAITGNYEPIKKFGPTWNKVFSFGAELFKELSKHLDEWVNSLPFDAGYQFGQVVGRMVFEIAAIVLPMTEVGQLTKVQVLDKLNELFRGGKLLEAGAPGTAAVAGTFEKLGYAADGTKVEGYTSTLKKLCETMCFVAGTPVWTVDGFKPIELVRTGDVVLSRDPGTGIQEYKPVMQTFVTHPASLYHVSYTVDAGEALRTESLTATGTHPFYVVNRGAFVPAAELAAGDAFLLAGGATAVFSGEWAEDAAAGATFTTYNFEVADDHTYFVGADGVWVHNTGGPCDEIAAIYARLTEIEGATPKSAFDTVIKNMLASEEHKARYAKNLSIVVDDAMELMYADAVRGGVVDTSRVMTYTELKGLLKAPLLSENGMQVHHTVPKYVQKLLGITDETIQDSVPGEILNKFVHQHSEESFHEILKNLGLPYDIPAAGPGSLSKARILEILETAYDSEHFNQADVWTVAKKWLSLQGI